MILYEYQNVKWEALEMERIILHGGMNASYVFIEMMLHLGFKSRFLAVCDSIDDRSDPFGIDEVCLDIRSPSLPNNLSPSTHHGKQICSLTWNCSKSKSNRRKRFATYVGDSARTT